MSDDAEVDRFIQEIRRAQIGDRTTRPKTSAWVWCMTGGKKPGVAFWATAVVVMALVGFR